MKSAIIPSLRVKPELRQEAENSLREGETLSSFMEESLRAGIRHRKNRQQFIARGLASKAVAEETGEYFTAAEVSRELQELLNQAEEKMLK